MHHDFVWNTVAYAQRTLGLGRDDVTLSAPKLFFGYALGSNMLFPFSVGGRCVLAPHRLESRDQRNRACFCRRAEEILFGLLTAAGGHIHAASPARAARRYWPHSAKDRP